MLEELRAHFRPEFLNRLDEIVVFHRLGATELRPHRRHPARPLRKLLAERDLELDAHARRAARSWPTPAGTRVYGARPLKRAIQHYLEDPLAQRVLAGEFAPGDTIVVDRGAQNEKDDKDALTFTRRRAETLATAS